MNTIVDASTSEIRVYAEKECGLTFGADDGRDLMLAEIFEAKGWEREEIAKNITHVKIKIMVSDGPGGASDVRVCGRWTIQRNRNVVVPIACYNVLADINEQATSVVSLENGKMDYKTPIENIVSRPVYPVSVVAKYTSNPANK